MPGSPSVRSDMRAGLPQVRRLARIIALAIVVMYVISGIYVVQPDERGVVKRFGRLVADDIQPGIHYRLPWPIDSAERPQVTSIKRMSVGYRIVDQLRGLEPTAREIQFVSGDTNIIEAQLLIQYIVKDPSEFLYSIEDPHFLVRKVGESVLTEKLGSLGVDAVLTTAKIEVQDEVKVRTQEILDSYGAGIEIVAAHLQDVAPPREVADAFREVASAREDRSRIIQEANGYLNRVVPMARGEAGRMVAEAQGYRTEKINRAEGDVARFNAVLAEYRRGPAAARSRIYLEVMEKVLAEVRKHVVDSKSGDARLDLRFLSPKQ